MKIYLLGTSHVSPESIEKIKKAFEKEPECVAVELDYSRFMSLKTGQTTSPPGLFLKILSWLQRRLGRATGVFPGEEMLKAVKMAGKRGVYLIDEDASIIAGKIRAAPLTEKVRFFTLPFTAPFETLKSKFLKNFSLENIPSENMVKEALELLKKKFPSFYRILVEERNRIMAGKILNLPCDNVLAVVGAGHVEGLKKILEKEVKVEAF